MNTCMRKMSVDGEIVMNKHPTSKPTSNQAGLASAWAMAAAVVLSLSALPASAQQYKVIGADGKVRAVHVGFRLDDREKIEREIRAALGVARK